MTDQALKPFALLSVSDQSGLTEFAASLIAAGYNLLATSGTGRALAGAALPYVAVEDYTGLAELLDGRVKTLHPKIHAGILARRELSSHRQQLEAASYAPIDIVVVNLYPFTKGLLTDAVKDPAAMTELVDVGGPTMIRAAAKNHVSVLPVIDPSDYKEVSEALAGRSASSDPFSLNFRRKLAAKVFCKLSEYDQAIGNYFSGLESPKTDGSIFPESVSVTFKRVVPLRYGENPHQKAAMYRTEVQSGQFNFLAGVSWEQLGGKELSYNNMLDLDAGLRLLNDFPTGSACAGILKHLNPCGVALANSVSEAVEKAKRCDPRSHFGGVIVLNREVDVATAEGIREDFAEIVIAPGYDDGALQVLRTSKNLRILKVALGEVSGLEARAVLGGVLIQDPDLNFEKNVAKTVMASAKCISERQPIDSEKADLELAWMIVKHVKSNAIVLVRDGLLIGVGAGQMSRIDSVELAIHKAKVHGHELRGAVAASDAFFPFPDSVQTLAEAGITSIISPAGAKRDDEVCAEANKLKVALLFAQTRHFRH